MTDLPAPLLLAAAEEELRQACTLGWRALSTVTPWGDSYEGFLPGGRPAIFERNYIWQGEKGGDILVEVTVHYGESRRDAGVTVSERIGRPEG